MKKLFKIIIGLLLFILLAVAALLITFDANNYKNQITEQVEQQTGRKFKIDGDIQLSVFPWIGLKLEQVALGNAQGFSERAFAEITQLDVKVMVLPLLKKEVQVDKIRMHGLTVSLEVNGQGQNNWSDLSQAASEDAAKDDSNDVETGKPEQSAADGGAELTGLVVNGIEFVDANIRWSDAQTDTLASISDLSLETSEIRFNEPVSVEFNAHVVSNQPEVDAKISLQTKVKFNKELNVFDVDGLELNVQTLMQSVSKELITLDFRTNAHVDLTRQEASLKSLEIDTLGAVLSANFNITQLNSEPKIKGSIVTNVIDGRALAKKLQIDLPLMANKDSLSSISMQSSIEASPNSVLLDGLKIDLDKTQITGWVHVLDVAQPKVDYHIKMSSINLDDYMAPVAQAADDQQNPADEVAEASTGKQDADVEIPLPVEFLRTLGANGHFEVEKVTMQNIEVMGISIDTRIASGLVSIKLTALNILKGRTDIGVDLNVQKTPAYTIAVKANNLHAGRVVNPVLKGVMGDEEIKIDGTVQLIADIKTQGSSLLALKKAATGSVNFDMNQTSVTGVDIEYFARNAIVDYLEQKKLDVSPEWRGKYQPKQTTAFRKIHASAVIAQGKLSNDDFIMDSKRIKVTGKGEVDIVNNTMDYNALIDLSLERKKTFAEKLLDEPMGVHVHGPFEKLAIDPDTKQLAKAATNLLKDKAKAEAKKKIDAKKKKLKRKAEKEKKKAKKKLEDKLRDKLKGLF
jgi:AsmA protein